MTFGGNHYTYSNIFDPNRPKPAKAPTRPELTAFQKAEAIARIKAVAEELAAKDAKEAAAEERRAARKRRQAEAANERYKAKLEADPVLAEARRMTQKASRAKKKGTTIAQVLVEEAKAVEAKNARLAAALEKIAERKARKAEQSRDAEAKRKAERQAEKAARLVAEAESVEAGLRALIVTAEDVVAYQNYMSISQDNRARYHYLVGRPLSDEEETAKERAVKSRLLAKLRENPQFLEKWKRSRTCGTTKAEEPKKVRRARSRTNCLARAKAARKANSEQRRLDLRARAPEVEAALLAFCSTPDLRAALTRYLGAAESLANRWRKRDGYPAWTGDQLEDAMFRKKERLHARLREEPTFLEDWDFKTRIDRRTHEAKKFARLKADPVKYAAYRERENEKKARYRIQDKVAKVGPNGLTEGESKEFARLMKIYEDARRKVERGE